MLFRSDDQQAHEKMLSIANPQGNANQITMRYHFTLVKMGIIKRIQTTNVGKDVGKREPSYTVGENVNWCSHCGKQYGGFSKN